MAVKIFPSVNDVYGGGSAGDGITLTEANIANIVNKATSSDNFITNGFNPGTIGSLNLSIPAGGAMIDGYLVEIDSSASQTLAASQTNYVYLQLSYDGSGNATGAAFVDNTTGTQPANSVFICVATTNGSSVTAVSQRGFKTYNNNGAGFKVVELWDSSTTAPTTAPGYTTRSLRYTKFGNIVFVNLELDISSIGSLSGTSLYIHGLPYTASAYYPVSLLHAGGGTNLSITAGHSVVGQVQANSDYIRLYYWGNTGGTYSLPVSAFGSSGAVIMSGHYYTDEND